MNEYLHVLSHRIRISWHYYVTYTQMHKHCKSKTLPNCPLVIFLLLFCSLFHLLRWTVWALSIEHWVVTGKTMDVDKLFIINLWPKDISFMATSTSMNWFVWLVICFGTFWKETKENMKQTKTGHKWLNKYTKCCTIS